MNTTTRRIGLLSCAYLLAIGCGAPDPSQEQSVDNGSAGETTDDKGADIGSTQQAVCSGWTAFVSEENPPVVCDSGAAVAAAHCTGSYCDNTQLLCQPTYGSPGASYWTSFFSEESTNYRYCNAGYWLTGLSCNGSYCDNNAVQCQYISGVSAINCYWTGWVSEEGGGYLYFGANYFARGMQCSGSNCDNKRFYVCQAQRP